MKPVFRLHSGGVVRNRQATLFVGPNGAGKSTLVLRLLEEGFSLLSDDEVHIDPDTLWAHPTWRSLLLKEDGWDLFPHYRDRFVPVETVPASLASGAETIAAVEGNGPSNPIGHTGRSLSAGVGAVTETSWWLDPEAVRAGCRARSAPIWGLVLLKRSGDRESFLVSIGQTEALTGVLREAMNFPDFRASGIPILEGLVKTSKAFKLRVGDLEETVSLLRSHLP